VSRAFKLRDPSPLPVRILECFDPNSERTVDAAILQAKRAEQKLLETTFSRDPRTGTTRYQDNPASQANFAELLQVNDYEAADADPAGERFGFVVGGDDFVLPDPTERFTVGV
jgi:hypothetical protein